MRKNFLILFPILLFILILVGCTDKNNNMSNNNHKISGETSSELSGSIFGEVSIEVPTEDKLYFTFDAYGEIGATLGVTELFEGSTQVTKNISYGFDAQENELIKDVLKRNGIVAINPILEDDIFEGWMIFKETISTDEEGFVVYSYERISGKKLYTTNEIFEMSMPKYNLTFVAKWSNIPFEDYFTDSFTSKPIA